MQLPIREFVRRDFVQLSQSMRVSEALDFIRDYRSPGQSLIYFYVVDEASRLVGVLQTRTLLTSQPDESLADVMIRQVIAIPESATVLEACEFFVLHKFLAFPIVDQERRLKGVVDINLFNEEVFGIPKTETSDDLFQAIGFHIAQARSASPLQVFRFRFPWLLVTIAGGTVCAFVAQAHEKTLQHTLVVAFFMTLVLSMGESVAVQSLGPRFGNVKAAEGYTNVVLQHVQTGGSNRDASSGRHRYRGVYRRLDSGPRALACDRH